MPTFTPPAPIDPDDDPFRVIFETKRFLDGQWARRGMPEYTEIRFGTAVKFQLLTHPRMQYTIADHRGRPLNRIFGIPIIEDPTMPDGAFAISYTLPIGA